MATTSRAHFALRTRIIFSLLVLFALLLVGRLYIVQIVLGENYSNQADRQYARPNAALYDRGNIFFDDEVVSAATLRSGFTVAINPRMLADAEAAYEALKTVLPLEKEDFMARAGRVDDPYEEIARRASEKQAQEVLALGLAGVNAYKERWRFYPGGASAAAVVGFVGYRGDELAGRYGLERYYNDVLEREEAETSVNFFAEIFANISSVILGNTRYPGDVVTSLEPSVQLFLEDALADIADAWSAKQAGGIIMHPKTGVVYALGVVPSFDLNLFNEVENQSLFANPLVESVFEMGSIIKPLTMAAGIDSGAVTAETTYVDRGYVSLDGAVISNFDGEGRGRVSMQEVLNQSLNTGAVFVAEEIGRDTLRKYFLAYGLGEETGIDLPNESAGLVGNLESPRNLEYATASFGQGIATTPIATVRALAALANGGVLPTPHVAKKIRYESGLSKTVSFPEGARVLKPKTAEEITRMLVSTVDTALLNGTVALPHYSIAAKTGTAQIAKEGGGGYYEDRFLHSFFGYFPAYEPEFFIFLYTLEPQGVRYASQTLTRPFMDIVQFLINHYDIPPDR